MNLLNIVRQGDNYGKNVIDKIKNTILKSKITVAASRPMSGR